MDLYNADPSVNQAKYDALSAFIKGGGSVFVDVGGTWRMPHYGPEAFKELIRNDKYFDGEWSWRWTLNC